MRGEYSLMSLEARDIDKWVCVKFSQDMHSGNQVAIYTDEKGWYKYTVHSTIVASQLQDKERQCGLRISYAQRRASRGPDKETQCEVDRL